MKEMILQYLNLRFKRGAVFTYTCRGLVAIEMVGEITSPEEIAFPAYH